MIMKILYVSRFTPTFVNLIFLNCGFSRMFGFNAIVQLWAINLYDCDPDHGIFYLPYAPNLNNHMYCDLDGQ